MVVEQSTAGLSTPGGWWLVQQSLISDDTSLLAPKGNPHTSHPAVAGKPRTGSIVCIIFSYAS